MIRKEPVATSRKCFGGIAGLLLLFGSCFCMPVSAQERAPVDSPSLFRWEVIVIDETAELLTLFFETEEFPLISVLRDTLGSDDPDVHRLRYVWTHTYATPSLQQRLASGVPFLASRFGNSPSTRNGVPPSVLDLSDPNGTLWQNVREVALKTLPFYPKPPLVDSVLRTYSRNQSRYRNSQLARASTLLDLYDHKNASMPGLSSAETRELHSRLTQAQKFLSQFLDPAELDRMYVNEVNAMRIACGRNWELLRQRAEAEGLYFDPLMLPDGTATHALLWVAKEDLEAQGKKKFDGRFLNIHDPFKDKGLKSWKGITETWYFDKENRRVSPGTTAARSMELIPLALYGLDYPKIPALLVDFRKPLNPKRRELSRNLTDMATAHLAPLSAFTRLGQRAARFLTHRTGTDMLQRSRVHTYSQLKTLLLVDSQLSSEMRVEIGRRVELIADNPLENDLTTELKVARSQYNALASFAAQPDGLLARLQRDRRAELTAGDHGGTAKTLFKVAKVASLGIYTHREDSQPDLNSLLAAQRLSVTHERFLRTVIASGSKIEIDFDMEKVRSSLRQIRTDGAITPDETARIALQIFARTQDAETRTLCLDTIQHLEKPIAQQAYLDLLKDPSMDGLWRTLTVRYLNLSNSDHPSNDTRPPGSSMGAN